MDGGVDQWSDARVVLSYQLFVFRMKTFVKHPP